MKAVIRRALIGYGVCCVANAGLAYVTRGAHRPNALLSANDALLKFNLLARWWPALQPQSAVLVTPVPPPALST